MDSDSTIGQIINIMHIALAVQPVVPGQVTLVVAVQPYSVNTIMVSVVRIGETISITPIVVVVLLMAPFYTIVVMVHRISIK